MKKLSTLLLFLLGLCVQTVVGQCPPGPPQSHYDGSTDGTPLANGARQFNFEYSKLAGFDCFDEVHAWFPEILHSYSSISPDQMDIDMAYAVKATATFFNVVVPQKGNYTLAIRYAYGFGHFPGITDRPEAVVVNGVVISYDMHFPITSSFEDYDYSSILVPLNQGTNTIQIANVSDHGVGRLDTMVIAPSVSTLCSDAPSTPGGLLSSLTGNQVHLTWTGSKWPSDCTTRHYDVYRSTTSGFIPSPKNEIATGLPSASYTDVTALCGTTYYYRVQGVDTAGASASLQKTVTTMRCAASVAEAGPAKDRSSEPLTISGLLPAQGPMKSFLQALLRPESKP
jgi:hypothetical protein